MCHASFYAMGLMPCMTSGHMSLHCAHPLCALLSLMHAASMHLTHLRMNSQLACTAHPISRVYCTPDRTARDGTIFLIWVVTALVAQSQAVLAQCSPRHVRCMLRSCTLQAAQWRQMSQEEAEWLVQTVDANIDLATGQVIPNSWPSIHEDFCTRFGTTKSLNSLQVAYTRAKGTDYRAHERIAAAQKRVSI